MLGQELQISFGSCIWIVFPVWLCNSLPSQSSTGRGNAAGVIIQGHNTARPFPPLSPMIRHDSVSDPVSGVTKLTEVKLLWSVKESCKQMFWNHTLPLN